MILQASEERFGKRGQWKLRVGTRPSRLRGEIDHRRNQGKINPVMGNWEPACIRGPHIKYSNTLMKGTIGSGEKGGRYKSDLSQFALNGLLS